MTANELARSAASLLHDQLVAEGHDPWSPYEFARAAADRQGIDVESTAAGAPILNKGRAVYIASDGLIIHERTAQKFEEAFLVAHEVGHVVLGDDGAAYEQLPIDPARPAESPSVGGDRVVDYGRKQRREIQMDLFAREFLLPRKLVRRLHLEENQTASDIAAKIGAPFEVVAQQLFDALLLPAMGSDTSTAGKKLEPNDLQRRAIEHRGTAYLLEAGPGTGKTQTLVGRVESLLAEGVVPQRILLLTFSNKAAAEMAGRIAESNKEAAASMWIGTFHAFGLDLVRRFSSELGLEGDPRLLDRTEAVELLEREFPVLPLRHYRDLYDPSRIIVDILSAISRAKDEAVDPDEYRNLAEEMRAKASSPDEHLRAEKALEVATVYSAYETLKRKANCIDFGDLVYLPVKLLDQKPEIRTHLEGLYDHVLVDEYQDVNRSSVLLLSAIKPSGENLWVVGDSKQSIYRFRGASSFNITRFGEADFPGGERGYLRINYRSSAEIVAAFSKFAEEMKAAGPESGLQSHRGPAGFLPQLRKVTLADDQAPAIADCIKEMITAGHNYEDQVIVCTGNEKLSTLARDLERLGIPILFLGSLFERPEVKDLLSLLSLLVDRRAMALARLANLPEFEMPLSDVSLILGRLKENGAHGLSTLAADDWEEVSEKGRKSVSRIVEALHGFSQTSSPWEVVAKILLDRTQMAARLASGPTIAGRTQAIAVWQLCNFIRAYKSPKASAISSLLEQIRRLVMIGDDKELRQLPAAAQTMNAVRLMTIHGAKGLEFPVVHLPGLNSDTLPGRLNSSPCPPPDGMIRGGAGEISGLVRLAHDEEQECLFYVALSRAKSRLFFYAPTKKANGHNRSISPFLNRIHQFDSKVHNSSDSDRGPEEDDHLNLEVEGAMAFHAHQIDLYESCPRRFFYAHILRTGGKRRATPFMQMHEVVRTVLQQLIRGDAVAESEEDLKALVNSEFERCGLAEHGYCDEFRTMALTMLEYFASLRSDYVSKSHEPLLLQVGKDRIIVKPDDVLSNSGNQVVLRTIRTGHSRASDDDSLSVASLILAAGEHFPGAEVELVHLSDGASRPLALTKTKLQNRSQRLVDALASIRLGHFPPNPSARSCPGCPAFFVCGPLPRGVLKKSSGDFVCP